MMPTQAATKITWVGVMQQQKLITVAVAVAVVAAAEKEKNCFRDWKQPTTKYENHALLCVLFVSAPAEFRGN